MFTKKWIAAAALAAAPIGVAHAGFIQMTTTDGLTTQVTNATEYDFNTGAKPTGYSGDGWVLPTSSPGVTAQPAGDSTPFLSVAWPNASGKETFTAAAGTSYNYFGLYWGSIDDYNSIAFYSGDNLLATVTGDDVIDTSFGDQASANSNRYVNFVFHEWTFDKIVFNTTNFAFESDNHAYANVPEPGTFALMGAGFAAFAFMRRRRQALTQA